MSSEPLWQQLIQMTGLTALTFQQVIMIAISMVLMYLAVVKKYEPLLLLPIAFGMMLTNLPLTGIMAEPVYELSEKGLPILKEVGGLFYYLYQGDHLGIFPPIIFMGVGAMTDFGPLIANPKSVILGAASQFGVYITFIIATVFMGYTPGQAGAIGIIGGADGPTSIFLATKMAPKLLGAIAVAAYSYMSLVPIIQPPIMRALTTKKERKIRMKQLRPVSKTEKMLFPIVVTITVVLLLPSAAPLVGMLMLGNLFRVSGVVERLSETTQNSLINIVTIFLGITVGATAKAEYFLAAETLGIIALGLAAFAVSTASGVLIAKFMNLFLNNKINPLIGSAGVSAVPMAARVSQKVGQEEDPGNFLLMHAMGPNVAGVIGTAIAAGVFLSLFG
ncbi:glutaconyl-CoA decarboxylase beta subunit [Halanaerobium congolense]|jgi:oxaloacetate decarboxylase beta subunit|uniref:Glutaconyl-CoA decarboxylase beta subunit n=1 Tax=Halanaerobium congolense TaxID=54121 RepID=A0A1G8IWF2_9FIRM|nr:sodium ion-translocating decarboxylase subunit beta [Halanaerobium congolense]SDI23132.1 glutaconyl-CoA decarboxylase beta subunit [Halanaerobium congolense]SES66411.1 glutaconyl-CoA decarboxylase beta subunit [Halanaerobium congolense]